MNNKKKTIRDTKILFLDSETTTWEVLNHIVLKIISCKWWPLFAWCLRAERLGDCETDRLTASMFSGVREVRGRPHLFFRHTSRFPEVLNQQQNGFSVRYSVPRGDLVASMERTLHSYDSHFAKSRFRRQMRAARWTTPSLRLRSVVTGTSQPPAPFEPNPTLLRHSIPSQCRTESTEGILPHPVQGATQRAFIY